MTVNLNTASVVTDTTPANILFGVGAYFYGVELNDEDTDGTTPVTSVTGCLGCTNGGGKFCIKPKLVDIGIDQTNIKRKGLTVKAGEEAYFEPNMTELSADMIAKSVAGDVTTGAAYHTITPRETLSDGDYIDKPAFIGKTATGEPVIVWFKTGLATSGFEAEGKSGEQSTSKQHIDCVGDIAQTDDVLPYVIIWPKTPATVAEQTPEEGGVE